MTWSLYTDIHNLTVFWYAELPTVAVIPNDKVCIGLKEETLPASHLWLGACVT